MTRRIEMPFRVKKPILACGADLKGAFAIANGREAVLVDGFGDLGDLDNFTRYEKAVKSQLKKMRVRPDIVVCDLHPGYFSTHFAEDRILHPTPHTLYPIQHHEAHIASAIVDHTIKGKVIGVAFDGTGYGSDGNIWGGEFFVGDMESLKRAGHFEYVAMPGADLAIHQPWRMAASYLYQAFGKEKGCVYLKRFKKWPLLKKMIDGNLNSPLTSSVGRLFDAVGSLILSKGTVSKEAQLPIELEAMADRSCRDKYGFSLRKESGLIKISGSRVIEGVVRDLRRGIDKSVISARFHNTIAEIILEMSLKLRKKFKIDKVALSGGVFQNRFLAARASQLLKSRKFKVYTHSIIPTNDSGIPIGQVAIARARCA